ncbi:hypothetical protein [Paenibacillus glycanilyticus]|uniref:hypothetical protein n=2 Tax=Paenibacillus glycanilyticus TaxID=126569 RepID=UPI00295F55E7|nr:hypothetical protein [Paenibacillus glycanilyticus]
MRNEDRRKFRRLKRRTARKVSCVGAGFSPEKSKMIIDAIVSHANDNRDKPRMKLCMVSRDQGVTWTEELINKAITNPEASTLKAGDLIKERGGEFVYVVVANECQNKINTPFQDNPDSPFFLPDGHLYWSALPYE